MNNLHHAGTEVEVWGSLAVQLFRLNGLFMDLGDEIASSAGQTSARWQVIASAYGEPRTVSEIARRMGLTRQSVQRTVDLLIEDGLAERIENEHHKRAKRVRLTPAGRGAMHTIRRAQRRAVQRWKRQYSTEDVRLVLSLLRDLERSLRQGEKR